MSAWLDDELSSGEAQTIRHHLEECAACREQVLNWLHTVVGLSPRPLGEGQGEGITTCLDEETLAAYSEAELSTAEAARAEQHLRECAICVGEVHRLVRLRVAMGEPAAGFGTLRQPEAHPVAAGRRVAPEWIAHFREWLRSTARALAQPWPAVGATTATAALVVMLLVRFVPFGGEEVQFRGVAAPPKVEVIADNVIARARPSEDEPIVARLSRGTVATRLEDSSDWTRIELSDGRRVWVRSVQLSGVLPRPLGEGRGEGSAP